METFEASAVQQPSLRQAAAGGALRCATFAIEDAARHLDWHYQEMGLPREEYLVKLSALNELRRAVDDSLQPLWRLAGAAASQGVDRKGAGDASMD
jgi:hypothetical protein